MRKFFVTTTAGCGSSSAASTNHCWEVAIQRLAARQEHQYLPPGAKSGKFSRLSKQADIHVAEAWPAGKKVTFREPGAIYRGPTRDWLRATKSRCGTPPRVLQ